MNSYSTYDYALIDLEREEISNKNLRYPGRPNILWIFILCLFEISVCGCMSWHLDMFLVLLFWLFFLFVCFLCSIQICLVLFFFICNNGFSFFRCHNLNEKEQDKM